MIFIIFIGILVFYFFPLLLFLISIMTSKFFALRSSLLLILYGMSEQLGRIRDLIATIAVPILALFTVPLNRDAAFDSQSLTLSFVFLISALISLISYGICKYNTTKLQDYGPDVPTSILTILENYCRETLIYFAVMLGVSAGPAVHP
jgi:hypothetical protein